MTDHVSGNGAESCLRELRDELAVRGVESDLDLRAAFPRLRVFAAGELAEDPQVAEFENSIVASWFGHTLWFAWPWAEPIAKVTDLARAAGEIAAVFGGDDDAQMGPAAGSAACPPLVSAPP